MSSLGLAETNAIAALADILYSFLPGSGAKYTWREAAAENDLQYLWEGGSKLPAITRLLENTYGAHRGRFCGLILTAIRGGLKYRLKGGNPVTREEIAQINDFLLKLHFKIPELHDAAFLNTLATGGGLPQAA